MWFSLLCTIVLMLFLQPEVKVERSFLSRTVFLDWLKNFRRERGVGLFGILLAGMSDTEAEAVINDEASRADIAKYAAEDCWFIYFIYDTPRSPNELHSPFLSAYDYMETEGWGRTVPTGVWGSPTPHQQHATGVHEVTQSLKLTIKQIPCFVFFERAEDEHFLYIPLGGMSRREIMAEVRSMFDFVREQKKHKNYSTFRALRQYERAKKFRRTGQTLLGALYNTSVKFSAEVISRAIP